MAVPHESLAVVVGRNCERLRNLIGVTQDELAKYARDLGLRWKASSVADFEAGRSAPKFSTVVTVAAALQWALEDAETRGVQRPGERPHSVSLADLVAFDGYVMLTETFKVFGSSLVDACRRGAPITFESHDGQKTQPVVVDAVSDLLRQSGLAEHRQAKRMGIEPAEFAALSLKLWQRTFSDERDRRAGPEANRQKRGQVTRAMQRELDELLPRFSRRAGQLAQLAKTQVWADGES